jgi:hypothetical protein
MSHLYEIGNELGNEVGAAMIAPQQASLVAQLRQIPLFQQAINQAKTTQPDWVQRQRGVTQSKAAWIKIAHVAWQYEKSSDSLTALTAMAINSMANLVAGADESHRMLPGWFERLDRMFALANQIEMR